MLPRHQRRVRTCLVTSSRWMWTTYISAQRLWSQHCRCKAALRSWLKSSTAAPHRSWNGPSGGGCCCCNMQGRLRLPSHRDVYNSIPGSMCSLLGSLVLSFQHITEKAACPVTTGNKHLQPHCGSMLLQPWYKSFWKSSRTMQPKDLCRMDQHNQCRRPTGHLPVCCNAL